MRRKCISIRSGLSSGHCVRTDSAKEVMFGILFAFQPTASCREATLDRSVFRIAHLYTRRESFRMHNVKSYSRTILCKICEYYQWLPVIVSDSNVRVQSWRSPTTAAKASQKERR